MNMHSLSLSILLLCTPPAFAGSDPALDVAKTKAYRTLYTVRALNSAATGAIAVAPGDACEIYSAGSIGLVSQTAGNAVVEYHPALVFLHDGELVNLWTATKAGLGHFCPVGTQFETTLAEMERLDAARLLTIEEQVVSSDEVGLSWQSRHLRLAREARKIALSADAGVDSADGGSLVAHSSNYKADRSQPSRIQMDFPSERPKVAATTVLNEAGMTLQASAGCRACHLK
ncbi:MAG: hypothetical protein ACYDAI_18090 [Trichloromonadaceae bacterium]